MRIAKRVYSLARKQNDPALMIGGYRALAVTLYFMGDFEAARRYATRGVQAWRSGGVQSPVEEVTAPAVSCLTFAALSQWHFAQINSCKETMAEAVSLARELNDMHALAAALWNSGILGHYERNPNEVERLASALIELSTRQNFAHFLAGGKVLRGWARSASAKSGEGISWIAEGIEDWPASGATLRVPFFLGLKAEALYLANRTSEALEAIGEAEKMTERYEEHWW